MHHKNLFLSVIIDTQQNIYLKREQHEMCDFSHSSVNERQQHVYTFLTLYPISVMSS